MHITVIFLVFGLFLVQAKLRHDIAFGLTDDVFGPHYGPKSANRSNVVDTVLDGDSQNSDKGETIKSEQRVQQDAAYQLNAIDLRIAELFRERSTLLGERNSDKMIVLHIPFSGSGVTRKKRSLKNLIKNVKGFVIKHNLLYKFKIACYQFLKEVGSSLLAEIIDATSSRTRRAVAFAPRNETINFEFYDFDLTAKAFADGQRSSTSCTRVEVFDAKTARNSLWEKIDCTQSSYVDLTPVQSEYGYLIKRETDAWYVGFDHTNLHGATVNGRHLYYYMLRRPFSQYSDGKCLVHDYFCQVVISATYVRSHSGTSGCDSCAWVEMDFCYVGFKVEDNAGLAWCKALKSDPFTFFHKFGDDADSWSTTRCVQESPAKDRHLNRCPKTVLPGRARYEPFYFRKVRRRVNIIWKTLNP